MRNQRRAARPASLTFWIAQSWPLTLMTLALKRSSPVSMVLGPPGCRAGGGSPRPVVLMNPPAVFRLGVPGGSGVFTVDSFRFVVLNADSTDSELVAVGSMTGWGLKPVEFGSMLGDVLLRNVALAMEPPIIWALGTTSIETRSPLPPEVKSLKPTTRAFWL